jgi:hypothetical protein
MAKSNCCKEEEDSSKIPERGERQEAGALAKARFPKRQIGQQAILTA